MKKILLVFSFLICFVTANVTGQILNTYFTEDFQSGLYGSKMIRHDYHDYNSEQYHNDVFKLSSAFSYPGPTKGWFDWYKGNEVYAVSPGKYTKGSAPDAWLITPAIELPDVDNLAFYWTSASYSEDEPNGYRIMVSETGSEKEDFVDEPVAEIENEQASFSTHLTSLENYRGKTVHIAIHNNSTGLMLMLKEIKVVQLKQFDDVMHVEATTDQLAKGTKATLTGRLTTEYGSAITNATVTWKYGDETYVQEINSLSVDDQGGYILKMDKQVDIPTEGTLNYSIDVVSGTMTASCDGEIYNFSNSPYSRVTVIEERSGTWCGWCVRGIVALEQTKEKYPNDFIGIAVHNNDVMTDASYDGAIAQYCSAGFPACVANRVSPFDPYPNSCLSYVAEAKNEKAVALMTVESELGSDDKLNVTVKTKFAFNATAANFNVAIVVLEQDVCEEGNTKYSQANNYAGGTSGSMGGYELKPSVIGNFHFNDVARGIFPGIMGAKAYTEFTKGEDAVYNYELQLPKSVLNKENIEVVALLINPANGEILTADSDARDMGTTSVESVSEDNTNVYVADGNVVADLYGVEGTARVSVYNLNGTLCIDREVECGASAVIGQLPASGLYIVKVSNEKINKSYKIIY